MPRFLGHEPTPSLVLDVGGDSIKGGFSGQEAPRATVSTLTRRPRRPKFTESAPEATPETTPEVDADTYTVRLIEHGVVTNFCSFDEVLSRTFEAIGADPSAQPLLVTEAPLNPKSNREMLAQKLFEQYDVPALHVTIPGALSLTAEGLHTGVVIDVGDGVSYSVPVFEGFALTHAVRRVNIGGRDLTNYLARLLSEERGCTALVGQDGNVTAREIKESLCYVARDYQAALSEARHRQDAGPEKSTARIARQLWVERQVERTPMEDQGGEKTFTLPDGTTVAAGTERFRCPEALFQPMNIGIEADSLQKFAYTSITKCEVDLQRPLSQNIVLTGGSMQFPGMEARMHQELRNHLPPSLPVKVSLTQDPVNSAWVGGSIMASLENMQTKWTTKEEYLEYGLQALHKRCPCLLEAGERASFW
eukprot:TRINITY_DN57287_c0_g1_i1.p1 TRINITY_DN57287_c0_g1~~TRINITY_DN57287_c0_g1_i1.p1  ORF type:complete len:432 (+),score=78.57 TRINITY_DN57287_c0_g1_i1:37-1296(+)